jgi:hypothetical protein
MRLAAKFRIVFIPKSPAIGNLYFYGVVVGPHGNATHQGFGFLILLGAI